MQHMHNNWLGIMAIFKHAKLPTYIYVFNYNYRKAINYQSYVSELKRREAVQLNHLPNV